MNSENVIVVKDVKKKFKVYFDKGSQLKERILFRNRNRYEERWVLNGIDFEVKKGEAVALIGHNGCGKSTMLKLLTKIMYPDSGTIETRGRISCLIELGAGFHPDMTGRENIYINASIFGLTKKEIDERLDDIIAFSELEAFLDNPVRTYSSGMYMRLAFAVAINVDADILLIDEILAVGDANFQAKCFNRLREIKAAGKTIVLVTHDTGTVERFCDRAIWINDGNIAAIGESRHIVDEYLRYMNGEKVSALEREEKRLQEKARAEEEARARAEEEARAKSAEEEARIRDEEVRLKAEEEEARAKIEAARAKTEEEENLVIDTSLKHFGTYTAVLKKVILKNAQGEPSKLLKAGEPFYIDYFYEVKKKREELVFGMGIYTLEGEWIFGTNTLFSGLHVETGDSGKITYVGKEMPLLSGKYILQVSITDINGTPVDFYRDYCSIHVINDHRDSGIVYMDNSWEIE